MIAWVRWRRPVADTDADAAAAADMPTETPRRVTMWRCHACDVTWAGADPTCWNCGRSGQVPR